MRYYGGRKCAGNLQEPRLRSCAEAPRARDTEPGKSADAEACEGSMQTAGVKRVCREQA